MQNLSDLPNRNPMKKPIIDNPSSAEARGKRIRIIRDHLLDLTREEFCDTSDIGLQSLKGWELAWGGGLSQLGADKIIKRARQLDIYCSSSWLMHGIGIAATYLTKDLETQDNDSEHIAKELLLFREMPNTIDTVIQDDAMIPFMYPGNYVGGVITKNLGAAIGKECIIVDDKNNVYVRVLNYGDESGRYNLSCLNQQAAIVKQEIKNIRIKTAAPIVWIRRTHREI